jgi:hypothetical protein
MPKTPFPVNDDARPQSSRRALLRGLAISPVAIAAGAGAGTLIAKAAEASPDAELIAICEQWKAARKASDDAWDASSECEDAAMLATPTPEALFVRDGDGSLSRWHAHTMGDGRQWYPADQLRSLRLLAAPEMPNHRNPRLHEIVAAHETWAIAKEEARETYGAVEAEARCNAIDSECQQLACQLAVIPARSLLGVIAKAEIAVALNCGMEELEFDLRDLLAPGKVISNETLALVVLRDLVHMGGGA